MVVIKDASFDWVECYGCILWVSIRTYRSDTRVLCICRSSNFVVMRANNLLSSQIHACMSLASTMLACLGKGKWNHGEEMPHFFSSLLNHAFNMEISSNSCVCVRLHARYAKRLLVIPGHEQSTMLKSWHIL